MTRYASFSVLVLALVLRAGLVLAQNPAGGLRGTIMDATGARVAGASVSLGLKGASLERSITAEDRKSVV